MKQCYESRDQALPCISRRELFACPVFFPLSLYLSLSLSAWLALSVSLGSPTFLHKFRNMNSTFIHRLFGIQPFSKRFETSNCHLLLNIGLQWIYLFACKLRLKRFIYSKLSEISVYLLHLKTIEYFIPFLEIVSVFNAYFKICTHIFEKPETFLNYLNYH